MRLAAVLFAWVLTACATGAPVNAPALASRAPHVEREVDAGEDVIVLALSGGGARAASFSLGVMQGMRAMRARDGRALLDHIVLISSVSGGSILSAYYGLHDADGLDTFRAAYLDKQWRLNSTLSPVSWWNAARGGVNGPNRLADWLDREIYQGARFAALRGPRIALNAADLYNATPFAFTNFYFDGVCSELSSVRVADAVAASMAVPMAFRPVLVEAFPGDTCPEPDWIAPALSDRHAPEFLRMTARAFRNYRAPQRQRYLHLVDGGVVDNLGVTSLSVAHAALGAPAPLTPREAVRARRIVFLVVNSEYIRARDFQLDAASPGGGEMLYSSLDIATDAAKRAALDAFRANLPEMADALRHYRCSLTPREVRALRGSTEGWACSDLAVSLEVIAIADLPPAQYEALIGTPTLVSLPPEIVDALIAGGRAAATGNAALQALSH